MKRVLPALFVVLTALAALAACKEGAVPSAYFVHLDITARSSTYANAYAYDSDFNDIAGAVFTVDGFTLVQQSGGNYYASIGGVWEDGSAHEYTVSTPDGGSASGSVVKPTGTLTGVTYDPPSPTIATSYTASPPSGGWPEGSVVYAQTTIAGAYYGLPKYPTGSGAVVFDGQTFVGASAVTFQASKRTMEGIVGFTDSSYVSVEGTATPW
jgi:hypothetical protein